MLKSSGSREIRAEDGRLPKSLEVHSEMPKLRPDSSQHKAQDHSEDSKRYIHSEEGQENANE